MATVTFYGGAGGVTGSKHLVEVGGKRILFDCGTFQGLSDVRERNRSFPFAPESIDHVVLSHAHIDHCGMLPLLVKRGFTGSIFATPATVEVARHMLEDMAGIELSDVRYKKKHRIGAPDEREPLFDYDDVERVMNSFIKVPYVRDSGEWHPVCDTVDLKMYDAGHILGSAVCVLRSKETNCAIGYTGDLGALGVPLLYDPNIPEDNIETFISESTYGSRKHEALDEALDRLAEVINKVCKRGGKMIVPAFSLGRTQAIVYLLHKLTDNGRIPRFPIFVDSPLATDLTKVYKNHRNNYDEESWSDFSGEDDMPLSFRNLRYVGSRTESIGLNNKKGPFMIISASGMMTAGRVVHHLKHCLSDKKNAVFITGYQAEGTMGRRILEGAKSVDIHGARIPVRADVELVNELSAHADRSELQKYLENIKGLKQVVLVHGEPHQADDFKEQLQKAHPEWKITRPDEGDTITFC
jgi:metallo-beta-lactamase family protein